LTTMVGFFIGVAMTIGVAATFPGGLVVGTDSRLNVPGKVPEDNHPKAFRIPDKRVAIAIAGELALTIKLKDEPREIEVMDFISLVRCALQHTQRDAQDSVRDAVDALSTAAKTIGYVKQSVQVIVGEVRDNGPALWMIEHHNTLGTDEQPKERGRKPPYLGIGKFMWYEHLASDKPNPPLNKKESDRKKASPPPPLPNGPFPDEASAIDWAEDVINWCCSQYDDCGGQPVIHVVK
jgi:hypothetical protein